MEYRESITKETEQEVKDFLTSHPSQHLSYWDWRESNNLILKIYKELEESTKGFGKEIDEVLKKHNICAPCDLSDYAIHQINMELADIKVIKNTEIYRLLNQLERKSYK